MLTTALLTTLLVVAPTWVRDVQISPPPAKNLRVKGPGAPDGLVLLAAEKTTTLTVKGPTKLHVELHALLLKQGPVEGGIVKVRLDQDPPQRVRLPARRSKKWSLVAHPLFSITNSRSLELAIGEGQHRVRVTPSSALKLGIALALRFESPGEKPVAASPKGEPKTKNPSVAATQSSDAAAATKSDATAAPPPPPPPPAEPDSTQKLKPTPLGTPAPTATDEAGATTTPQAADAGPVVLRPSAVTVVGEGAQPVVLKTGNSDESFLHVTKASGLELQAKGPGTLLVEIHAHRSEETPESMDPLVVAITMDEVLAESVAVALPVDPTLKAENNTFGVSSRATLQIPLDENQHRIQLSLSDSAMLGASMRASVDPTLVPTPDAKIALKATREAPSAVANVPVATQQEVVEPAPSKRLFTSVRLGAHVGPWFPASLELKGVATMVDARVEIPQWGQRFAVGLVSGYAWATHRLKYADWRSPSGRAGITTDLYALPVVIDAQWRKALGPVEVELGLGMGIMTVWANSKTQGIETEDDLHIRPLGSFYAAVSLGLGPGSAVLRVGTWQSTVFSSPRVKDINPSGTQVTAGYQLELWK